MVSSAVRPKLREVPENGFQVVFVHYSLLQDLQQVQSFDGTEYQTSCSQKSFRAPTIRGLGSSLRPAPGELDVEPRHQVTKGQVVPRARADSERSEADNATRIAAQNT